MNAASMTSDIRIDDRTPGAASESSGVRVIAESTIATIERMARQPKTSVALTVGANGNCCRECPDIAVRLLSGEGNERCQVDRVRVCSFYGEGRAIPIPPMGVGRGWL